MSKDTAITVGIIGLGRSGWNIHARSLSKLPDHFKVTGVTDFDDARMQEAQESTGCETFPDADALIASKNCELIVVASPNPLHPTHSIQALEAGKHVVCEKPFALNSKDAAHVIDVANKTQRILAPFQNRRYEAHFQKVKSVIESGILGDILQINLCVHGFQRRWDWQTLKEYGGGILNNHGPHVLDHALQLLKDKSPEIFVDSKTALAAGDAEDHIKIVLRSKEGTVIDAELTSACAYPRDRWLVMGTAGSLRGSQKKLEWKWVDWSSMPKLEVDTQATQDRSYNKEELPWQKDTWEGESKGIVDQVQFYKDLYKTLREDAPLVISPQSVLEQIQLIERCRALSSHK